LFASVVVAQYLIFFSGRVGLLVVHVFVACRK
jgi:hypothetical protein